MLDSLFGVEDIDKTLTEAQRLSPGQGGTPYIFGWGVPLGLRNSYPILDHGQVHTKNP